MSFLRRIAERTALGRPAMAPKGFVRRMEAPPPDEDQEMQPVRRHVALPSDQDAVPAATAGAVRRAYSEEDEETQPVRRTAGPRQGEAEEAARPLRRGAKEDAVDARPLLREAEEEDALQNVRDAANEEEARPLRHGTDASEEDEEAWPLLRREEEELQTLRREAEPEEEEMQPLRGAAGAPDEEQEEALPLRRAAMALSPGDEALPEEMRGEPEPRLGPLRRTDGSDAPASGAPIPVADPGGWGGREAPTETLRQGDFSRPTVQIDQIDVLIHEPAAPGGAGRAPDRSRAIRARYLRRL